MSKRHCRCLLFLTVLASTGLRGLAAQASHSSQPLGLSRARQLARQASPERRAALAAVEAADGLARQAGAFPNPVLAVSHERTSRERDGNNQVIALLQQPVDLTGAREARRDAARHQHTQAQAELDGVTADLDLAVARAWAVAVAGDRRLALADRMLGVFRRAEAMSAERLAAGDVSGLAHRRLQLESARWAAAHARALLEAREARLALAALITADPDSIRTLATAALDTLVKLPQPGAVEMLLLQARERRADLRAARAGAEAAVASARAASRERIPTPILAAGYKSEAQAGLQERLTGFALGFTLPLPLWNQSGGRVQAARAQVRAGEADVAAVERRVVREVLAAWEAWQANETQRAALADRLGPEASAALTALDVAFAEGDIPLIEWLDAQRAWHDAYTTFITLEAESLTRTAELEYAAGGTPSDPESLR